MNPKEHYPDNDQAQLEALGKAQEEKRTVAHLQVKLDASEVQRQADEIMDRVKTKMGLKKETNPKDAVGIKKAGLQCVSCLFISALAKIAGGYRYLRMKTLFAVGLAMAEGARKYGRHNYRVSGVRASVYYDALMRHLHQWWYGEDIDKDSNVHHIIKALACMAVFVDAMENGKWVDDRPPKVQMRVIEDLSGYSASRYYELILSLIMRWWEGGQHDMLKVAAYHLMELHHAILHSEEYHDDRPREGAVLGSSGWLEPMHAQVAKLIEMYPDSVPAFTEADNSQETPHQKISKALAKRSMSRHIVRDRGCKLCTVPMNECPHPDIASTTRTGCVEWSNR